MLNIVESSVKMKTENDPYFIEKKIETLKSDLFIANSCPFLNSQKIYTGAHAKITCVIHSLHRT